MDQAGPMRSISWLLLAVAVSCPWLMSAAQFTGAVRAADQIVPGATVTAQRGETKVTAYTDENGRFTMELAAGQWDVEIDMFEFTPAKGQITIADKPVAKDWVLNMPKIAGANATAAV